MRYRRQSIVLSLAFGCAILPDFSIAQGNCPTIEESQTPSVRLTNPSLTEIPKHKDLDEFSGIAIVPDKSPDGFFFWTMDDEEKLLIQVNRKGEIIGTVPVDDGFDLEGIAYDPKKGRLAVIREQRGIIKFFEQQGGTWRQTQEFTVAGLIGYEGQDAQDASGHTLKEYYDDYTRVEEEKIRRKGKNDEPNSGWEGMTFTDDGRMFVVKEKNPAILIEIQLNEADLQKSTISNVIMLNCGVVEDKKDEPWLCPKAKAGASLPFKDAAAGKEKSLDFSGLTYDATRGLLWMSSDSGRSAIIFDPTTRTFSAFPLKDKSGKCLDKPEGIEVSADGKKLYLINDQTLPDKSYILSYDIQ